MRMAFSILESVVLCVFHTIKLRYTYYCTLVFILTYYEGINCSAPYCTYVEVDVSYV